jgi:uncharacterized protein (DUF1330 family)
MLKLAIGLSAGLAIGAGGMAAVMAASPPIFMVAEVNVKDQATYEATGVVELREQIKAGGGKLIAGGYNKTESLDGSPPPNRYLIFQYPDHATAMKMWTDHIKPWQSNEKVRAVAEFRTLLVNAPQPDMK